MNHHIEKEDRHLVASFASFPLPERAARLSSSSAMRFGTTLLQLLGKPSRAERDHAVVVATATSILSSPITQRVN
ncbi:hypothetical protein [Sinorhizobium glycinis]|uniref:hypothetical protein n=1 Tax=Sinorhizobium glycinis TaxID=1472378 RepID=UPI0012E7CA82|nr:hypothetical protein [Sinorhizobium glycinis]